MKVQLLTTSVSFQDVQELADNLPNVVYSHLVEDELFSHLDFLWAIDLNDLVNNYVIDLLAKY